MPSVNQMARMNIFLLFYTELMAFNLCSKALLNIFFGIFSKLLFFQFFFFFYFSFISFQCFLNEQKVLRMFLGYKWFLGTLLLHFGTRAYLFSPEERPCHIFSTRNNCCEFLASYAVILQSYIQPKHRDIKKNILNVIATRLYQFIHNFF